jgi:hypothetical protein
MPHVHSMTFFDVDKIEVAWNPDLNAYVINLSDEQENPTRVTVWRTSNGGEPPKLIVEGWNANQLENSDAIDTHSPQGDGQPETE